MRALCDSTAAAEETTVAAPWVPIVLQSDRKHFMRVLFTRASPAERPRDEVGALAHTIIASIYPDVGYAAMCRHMVCVLPVIRAFGRLNGADADAERVCRSLTGLYRLDAADGAL